MKQDEIQPDPKDVERRKNELLASARREASGERSGGSPNAMMGAGLQFVVSTLVCLFIGQWLDRKLGTFPWLMLAGMMIGAGLGFWTLLRLSKAAEKDK